MSDRRQTCGDAAPASITTVYITEGFLLYINNVMKALINWR